MNKFMSLCTSVFTVSFVAGCTFKQLPFISEDESTSEPEANRIVQYRVIGDDKESEKVTEVFGIRLGDKYLKEKHGDKLAVVVPDLITTFKPDPTAWEWRRSDPDTVSIIFEPPEPNALFSEYILHYDKKTRQIMGIEGWAANSSRQCGALREKLIDVLEKKYRFKQVFAGHEDSPKIGITDDRIEITIGCDQLRLLYFDLKPVMHEVQIDASSL